MTASRPASFRSFAHYQRLVGPSIRPRASWNALRTSFYPFPNVNGRSSGRLSCDGFVFKRLHTSQLQLHYVSTVAQISFLPANYPLLSWWARAHPELQPVLAFVCGFQGPAQHPHTKQPEAKQARIATFTAPITCQSFPSLIPDHLVTAASTIAKLCRIATTSSWSS